MSVLRTGAAALLTVAMLVAARPAAAAPATSPSAAPSAAPASPIPAPAPKQGTTIFDYQKQLGLTDDQVKKIHTEFDSMQSRRKGDIQKLQALGGQVNQLIAKQAPIPDIKTKLAQFYSLQLQMKIDDLQTSRNINAIMTKEQLAKWQAIREKAQAQQQAGPHR